MGRKTARTDKQRREIVEGIDGRRATGVTIKDACIARGIVTSQYYKWSKELHGKTPESPRGMRQAAQTPATQIFDPARDPEYAPPPSNHSEYVKGAINDAVNAFINELDSVIELAMAEAVEKLAKRYNP